jgi:TP901 family phage tail tape measure protein
MTAAYLGELYATMSVNTSALDHGIVAMRRFEQQANASLARIQKNWERAGASMKTFGRTMTQFVTLPMTLVGGASLKMYADFEFSMNKVVSLVGVAREQVDEWSKSILDLAPSLGKSPRELADAMYFITSAGIRGTEAMDILEESAKSSAAGLGETKVIADLLTSAMNAYGKENLSAARANDILVATVREGKAEANLLAQSMGLVLPIASAMGAEFTDVGAATAAMTRTGTKAATAAIQLRQMFNSILKPAEEAEQALIDMGISSEQLRKIIDEGSLLDALQKLDEVTKEYSVAAVGKVIPNIRSLTGFLDIMGKNVDANVTLWGSIEDSMGDAERTFQQTADTVRFRMAVAFSRVTTSATRFGETMAKVLVPIMEKAAVFIEKIIKRFDALSTAQKILIARIGLVVAALGPFITILGFLVGNVVPGLIMVMRAATKTIVFFGAAIRNNPVGALITVVTTLVSLYALWKSRANQAAEAQMTLNKATKMAEESIASERVAMEQLFRIAQDVNRGEEERAEAIKAINQESPEYLGNINKENILQASATKAKEKYIAELVREAKVKAVMAELNRLEVDYLEQVTNKGAAVLTFWQKLAKFASAGAMTVEESKDLEAAFEDINLENAKTQFDTARKALEGLLDEIVELEDIKTLTPDPDDGAGGGGLLSAAEVLQNYTSELKFAKDMQIAFGKSFDRVTHELSAAQQAVEGYLRAGIDPLSETITTLVSEIRQLELALSMRALKTFADDLSRVEEEIAKMQDAEFEEMFTSATAEMQKEGLALSQEIEKNILAYHGLLEESEKTTGSWSSVIRGAFTGMANVITNALNSTENVFKAFGKFFGDFIKGMIIKLAAATAAALTLAIVLSLVVPGKSLGKIFGSLDAASKFGDIFKAGFKSFARLQHGGVVPPGYPNDTYPALLTSGEKVIPAGGSAMQNTHITVNVEGGVEGENLYWIVKEVERKYENSYS